MKVRCILLLFLLMGCKRSDPNDFSVLPGFPVHLLSVASPITRHETWIAFGQSNMDGEGQTDLFAPSRNIGMINAETHNYAGIAYAFAIEKERQGVAVTLIQCAVGGMTVDHFAKGGDLYNRCLNIIDQTKAGPIDGVIFDQGPSDATANHPTDWTGSFMSMVYGFRDAFHNPHLPVIFGRTDPPPSGYVAPYDDDIRGQQTTIRMPYVWMVDTDGLPRIAGGWHFTKAGHLEAGRRFSQAPLEG